MKLWRERIAEARGRGRFTKQDMEDAEDYKTCAVGEQVKRGVLANRLDFYADVGLSVSHAEGSAGVQFWRAVLNNAFDRAEVLLDEIEDQAMAVKQGKQKTT